ncbi:FAD-dependent monooxygenase [Alkalimonas collagenimarina]|uniref:FAD-dependent monooxygenase n=1 Tax=Alkalimonas collagenimarina TaxID=400390 RepID=A0ABT9GX45_9GAMM|nr:FAD-dependent monooxygenase [Alkalimonas collagenimarina]MDP4535538.1 FAD-dependent monooxygenase [Alkalimonas collagenimarina]
MYDLTVVGGGMVGASMAALFAQQGWRVALIEAVEPASYQPEQPADLRVSAINRRSQSWLERTGAWSALSQMRLCPYRRLQAFEHPSDVVEFAADSIGQSHLGHIVENRLLQLAIWQQFPERLTLHCPAKVVQLQQDTQQASLLLDNGEQLQSRLVIAADGAGSQLRQMAGIGTRGWRYAQGCLVAHVQTEDEQQDVTWQQFTEQGPRAFLPLSGQQASLVWYDKVERVKQLASLSPPALTEAITAEFPAQLGSCKVERAVWFPLARQHALQYSQGRVVLVGDAAHAIHPMAGQGVNLGFADAACLAELLLQAGEQGVQQPATLLQRYQRERQPQNWLMMTGMDALYQGFGSRWPFVRLARRIGLRTAARSGALKEWLTRYATG